MRKVQKKQLEELCRLMDQAHDEIRKAIEGKNMPVAMRLAGDCQEGAVTLGNLIEKTEGKSCAVIPLLEEYCELTYRIQEELASGQPVHGNRIYKSLRSLLLKIESSIRWHIKVRLEAVFLPYKASMWDSLESVWRAADEDPDCDAYVIPIPYYDKNPDGSFREMHYEGNDYPKDVPVMRYEDYDFAKRKPDMIFIHNPYDEFNYVTSVHPSFYSKNLKLYTDRLIYIPYFVLDEIRPEEQERVASMEHFCTVPAVLYADQVIVQSEDMRQIYIDAMVRLLGEKDFSRKYWENKILGLGSPKYDKVLSVKAREPKLPREWLEMIQKPDGSRKKVILYNTSVSALLQQGEDMLYKMQDVFRVFKENRKEAVLWWRPHPLIKATIESMRPQLWEQYSRIVEQYRNEGWGIYDDTADLDRAIAVSDAYYGDGSSLVQLYQKTGKPIMIQNVETVERADDE